MRKEIKTILSKGLAEGYAGNSDRGFSDRAGFALNTSDYKGPEGKYHDEWAGSRNGGGQELVRTPSGPKGTRVYAGGSLSDKELEHLEITEKDVIGKLLFFVDQLGEKTRLDTSVEAEDGDWKYSYNVIKKMKEIPVTLGEEKIEYKRILVFIHFHVNSPVR